MYFALSRASSQLPLIAALTLQALAQTALHDRSVPEQPNFAVKPVLTHDHVRYDEPGDGALWALGAKYKASFGAAGATFIPAFGARAPKNYPHALSPDRVTIGGEALTLTTSARAERDGDRVAMPRGAFTEQYDLALDSMEQSFVFDALPRTGDLVLHIPVASELEAVETQNGLEFSSDFGTLTYSRAIAIDACGRRFAAPTHLVDGAIQIEVRAADLAVATFPLVIDPVIGTIYALLDADDLRNTDSAWDAFNGVWLITWTKAYSATDNDVYGRTYTSFGTFTEWTIDFTGVSWNTPRCAQLASAHQFLTVASAVSAGTSAIYGRTLQPSGTQGVQFDISGPDTGAKTNPDVGGNSATNTTGDYCVVWERQGTSAKQIASRLVSSFSVPGGGNATYLTAPTFWDSVLPSVSKSSNGSEWLVAYTFNDPITNGDIWAARVASNGTVLTSAFQVTSNLGNETQPVVSSFQMNSSRAIIAYRYRQSGFTQSDIWAASLDGASVVSNNNMTGQENSGFQSRDQSDPAIDCDGGHFVLAYSEFDPNFITWDVFAMDLALIGTVPQIVQGHVPVQPYGLSEYRTQVAAQRNILGTPSHRYCISWDFRENDTDYDIIYRTFDAYEGGTSGVFCVGDGTVTPCPCTNSATYPRGCPNSSNAQGALLALTSGTISTVNDTAVLTSSFMPAGTACMYFQGSAQGSALFGDGLLCASGTITRLAVKFAPSGSTTFPAAGDPALSVAGAVPAAGGPRFYQVWYRDAATYCTSSTYNTTNGVFVNWAR